MGKMNDLLNQRLTTNKHHSKMTAMAQQSANGNLTSFSGIFSVTELSDHEKQHIENILNTYIIDDVHNVSHDLNALLSITSEVKAISNQAALLHGERIKKAHSILTRYRDGAFTAWLLATYGNRQTPYNLMQYYELYEAMPKILRPQIEVMPKQAIYALASREGSLQQKQQIIENYKGENKEQLLSLIRTTFPLDTDDGRRHNSSEVATQALKKIHRDLIKQMSYLTTTQKATIKLILKEMLNALDLS